ncbi:MAG: Asp-tRNA(Asn)/Glu-tRNA(Gln) amidotransferase subunit GatB [Luteibaculaceae bacterium]
MSDIYSKYETVVGLEIHVQLNTKSKAYAPDPNVFGSTPNTNVSVITLGHPGVLPKPNAQTVKSAISLGLALGCKINTALHYDRKNYFYADLPKGYQITQDATPICTGGSLTIKTKEGTDKVINITRIHMEEDAGKSIHDLDPFNTLIDLNRAGVPLLEIVSEPEISSPEEAQNYVAEVRKLVRYLDICDGNMEEGSLRCDANVSVRLKGATKLGNRCEVKNMNSTSHVKRAVEHEVKRQIDLIEKGETISVETRTFDPVTGTTSAMRSKEMAHDYRYFPEPDILPLRIAVEEIEGVKQAMPPLPTALFEKFLNTYNLSAYDANVLTEEKEIALYFERLVEITQKPKSSANWVMGAVKSYLNQKAVNITEFPLQAEKLAEIIVLIEEGKISNSAANQQLFPALVEQTEKSAIDLANELNIIQESDSDMLGELVQQALAKYPEKVEEYKAGKKGLLGLFMGEVMKLSQGKADPKVASQLVREALEN